MSHETPNKPHKPKPSNPEQQPPTWRLEDDVHSALHYLTNAPDVELKELLEFEEQGTEPEVELIELAKQALEVQAHAWVLDRFPDRATAEERAYGVDKFSDVLAEMQRKLSDRLSKATSDGNGSVPAPRAKEIMQLAQLDCPELVDLDEKQNKFSAHRTKHGLEIGKDMQHWPDNPGGSHPMSKSGAFSVTRIDELSGLVFGTTENAPNEDEFQTHYSTLVKGEWDMSIEERNAWLSDDDLDD